MFMLCSYKSTTILPPPVDATLLKSVLLTIAQCWDADWGVVETWEYKGRTVDSNNKPLLPYGGWLTYLSRAFAVNVAPPPDVFAERTSDGGLILLVSQEPFDVANPTHVTPLDAVQKSLTPVQRSVTEAFYKSTTGSSGCRKPNYFPDFSTTSMTTFHCFCCGVILQEESGSLSEQVTPGPGSQFASTVAMRLPLT